MSARPCPVSRTGKVRPREGTPLPQGHAEKLTRTRIRTRASGSCICLKTPYTSGEFHSSGPAGPGLRSSCPCQELQGGASPARLQRVTPTCCPGHSQRARADASRPQSQQDDDASQRAQAWVPPATALLCWAESCLLKTNMLLTLGNVALFGNGVFAKVTCSSEVILDSGGP